jgi:hypothetical protein
MSGGDSQLAPGARAFLEWRKQNPGPTLSQPNWYDSRAFRGRRIKGRNRIDFSGANIAGLTINKAFAEGLHLRDAVIEDTRFDEGDFSWADFSRAKIRNTIFNKTIFTGANFDGATFVNCNLNRVNLVGASFCVKEITETVVYGISAWDLKTAADMKQSRLVIDRTYELYSTLIARGDVPTMVDDILVAELIHLLNNNASLRNVMAELDKKGVLLLGGFKDGGLERLYSIRERLARHGYRATIFDFERPESLTLLGTVVTLAGLSRFVIADLSGPSVS